MREIKYRGLRTDRKGWVYGFYWKGDIYTYILCHEADDIEVIPESVGQFTGLKGLNGQEIYQGDILQTTTDKAMVVSWSDKYASFVLNREGWAFSHWFGESCDPDQCVIIGNIHENPELLEVVGS